MRGNLSIVVLAAATLWADRSLAAQATFKDWTVVCDNVRNCTAFGFPEEFSEPRAFLKIERGAAANAAPKLTAAVESEAEAVQSWSLQVDGREVVAGLKPKRGEEDGLLRAALPPAQARSLAAALLNGTALAVKPQAGPGVSISLAGSSAALRWMDDQQKRAGTVTALAAKGPGPAASMPPPPAIPLIRRGPVPSQERVGEILPRAVRARFGEDCDKTLSEDQRDPISARLAPGVILWGDICSNAAYQSVYSLFLSDEAGGQVRPVALEDGRGGVLDNQIIGVEFDVETLTLSSFYKGRGIADCGEGDSWTWDGKAFRLSDQSVMTECRGLPPEEWPTSFVSRQQ